MKASFDIFPIERFAQAGAKIKRPIEITAFSYDSQHTLHHDTRSLKYYYSPELGVSLADGFDTFRKSVNVFGLFRGTFSPRLDDTKDEHLNGLLSALVNLEQRRSAAMQERQSLESRIPPDDAAMSIGLEEATVQADVVTWRGMVTKLMSCPYDDRDGFQMNATLFDGTIFLEDCHAYKVQRNLDQSRRNLPRKGFAGQEMMSYWGYKFETLCMLPDTWDNTPREFIESRSKHIVDNHDQYVSIVETKIGDTKLVLGGEVDGVWDTLPDDLTTPSRNYIELKTSAELSHHSDPRFEQKLFKFWIQSFLLGVPRIIVGFRSNDEEGRLLRVQEYATTAIPKMVREQGLGSWDSFVCINFLAEFLKFLTATIRGKSSDFSSSLGPGVWRIERKPKSPIIEVYSVEETGYGQILSQEWIAWRKTRDPLEAAKAGLMDRL